MLGFVFFDMVHLSREKSSTRPTLPALPAWHAGANPHFQGCHKRFVRKRWNRPVLAGGPRPEDERIHLHVFDDLFARAMAPVPRGVLQSARRSAPWSGLPISWTTGRGARSLHLAQSRRRCWSPDGTSDTAGWARRGRLFRGRPAVDGSWRRPSAWETRPDGSSCTVDA